MFEDSLGYKRDLVQEREKNSKKRGDGDREEGKGEEISGLILKQHRVVLSG